MSDNNFNFLEGKKIFLVEDNAGNRAIEEILLEKHGAKTAMERWGRDTIPRLRAAMPVDIILLDLMFPNNITGFDVFKDIRSHPEFDHIPIVAVSASDPSSAIPKTKEYGFAGFISKPIHMDNFPKQVLQILEGQPVWVGR